MRKQIALLVSLVVCSTLALAAEQPIAFNTYRSPQEVNSLLQRLAGAHPSTCRLHAIAKSPGGREMMVIEIGPAIPKGERKHPAVLVAANMEGIVPLSTEAALFLTQQLLTEKSEQARDRTWYVLPVGNPDAAARFFAKPPASDPRNGTPYNDDMDDREDEDGSEDLNGDGVVTSMRVEDPEGAWMPVDSEPRLMKKADWSKGEKGVYKLYTEGTDDDGDGEYNEDGPGGVNIGVTFPHLFKHFTKTGGAWPGSEAETFGLLEFIYARPEIALAITFGSSNFCLKPPRSDRSGEVDMTRIKIPKEIGKELGLDTERTYTMDELREIAKRYVPPEMEVTDAMIASFLGLGAVVNPLPDDMSFYKELSEKYKEFLKANKLDAKRLDPATDRDGSFELFAYYHLGVPSFSMDFWTLPEVEKKEAKTEGEITPEKLEGMTNEEFLALGEEKIAAFLKSVDTPPGVDAPMVIGGIKSGMMNTKKMAEMLREMKAEKKSAEGGDPKEQALLAFSDKELGGKGFIEWKTFKHPTLGDIEIGGQVPYASNTPPPAMIDVLLKGQVPWVFQIADRLPRVKIAKTETKDLGGGLYRLEAWVENTGYLPYPAAMGRRNERISPVIVSLDGTGFTVLDGKKRASVSEVGGHSSKSVEWILRVEKRARVGIAVSTMNAGGDSRQVDMGGGK